jgi:hypothetical protein
MQKPILAMTLRPPFLRRRITPRFPEVAARRMVNLAVVSRPCPEQGKEEIEFVTVTQCSFKCKKNFKTKKKEKIESSYISFSCCNHVFLCCKILLKVEGCLG